MDYQDPSQQDSTIQLLRARLAQRAQVNPLIGNVVNAARAFAGKPANPDPLLSNLQGMQALNSIQTGTPEFELRKAQTLANMGVMKDLQTKQLEAEQVREAADKVGATDNAPSVAPSGPTMPPNASMPTSGPRVPNGPIYNPQAPALVAGIGGSQGNTQPSTDTFDPNKPKFIQEPPTSEFDSRAMANIKKPGKQIIDPNWQAQLDVQKAAQQDMAIKKQEQGATIKSAINVLRVGVGKFKDLTAANQGAGRIAGAVGQVKGMLGMNAPATTWDSFTNSAATMLAAAASPRTPTLLVQYFKNALGPQTQTNDEFMGRIGNLTNEQAARQSGYGGDWDQNAVDQITQGVLNSPRTTSMNMGGNGANSSSIPSFKTIEEADAKGYKGPAIIGGVKGKVT